MIAFNNIFSSKNRSSYRRFCHSILNIIVPAVCYACNRRIAVQKDCLCPYCFSYLERKNDFIHMEEELGQRYFRQAASIYKYGHIARQLLHIYKYNSIQEIGKFFSNIAVDILLKEYAMFVNVDGIVAVPMHRKRYNERSFDHVHYMAKIISKSLNLVDYSNEIIKSVNSPKQAFLSFNERLTNPIGTFQIKNKTVFKDKTILVIDDIFTTGATANALSKTLIENGAKETFIFVMATGSSHFRAKKRKRKQVFDSKITLQSR